MALRFAMNNQYVNIALSGMSSMTIVEENAAACIGCGVCAGVCPCGVWTMQKNTEMTFPVPSLSV